VVLLLLAVVNKRIGSQACPSVNATARSSWLTCSLRQARLLCSGMSLC
jgi:hypothetical protein